MSAPASVADVVPAFADAFPFDSFNEMQRAVVPAILDREDNVVVSAPTGSGKTAIAELAICHCLANGGTALYVTPLRALTTEREDDWQRFESLGHRVYVVTGERELDPGRADRADILVMTPEKVDAATRNHRSDRYRFITDVDCCIVDEVHLLDSDARGSVLDATIARMRRLADPRIVAMSATMGNVGDVAAWLDAPPETTFQFDASHRPVPLEAAVYSFDPGENEFADKYRRLYRAIDVAKPHLAAGGQTLIFVASRRDARRAAETIVDTDRLAGIDLAIGDDLTAHQLVDELGNDRLGELARSGVAFHHAGLSRNDRERVESLFRSGAVSVLVSTTTLAWGVNLPARAVIIRDTNYHDPFAGPVPMSAIDVLQMLGRAGRPGYDDVGYGAVICHPDETERYREILEGDITVDSRLLADLAPHLNTEIALGAVTDRSAAVDWVRSTFAWTRHDDDAVARCVTAAIDRLEDGGHLDRTPDDGLTPTEQGRLASKYYLSLPTAERFARIVAGPVPTPRTIVDELAACPEFADVSPRGDEWDAIEAVLGNDRPEAPGRAKVLAVLVASMAGEVPARLRGDAWIIRRNASRLLGALAAWSRRAGAVHTAALVERLTRQIEHGLDERAARLLAVEGIGPERARRLVDHGIEDPGDLVAAPDALLTRVGWSPDRCTAVRRAATAVPSASVDWAALPDDIGSDENVFLTVPVAIGGSPATATVIVRVNGIELHRATTRGERIEVPVAIHGGGADHFVVEIEVVFPGLPLDPIIHSRELPVA